jgi:hypothetical protein
MTNYREHISLQVFLFDSANIYSVSWDTVKKYNLFAKRVQVDSHDRDSLGWTITYP